MSLVAYGSSDGESSDSNDSAEFPSAGVSNDVAVTDNRLDKVKQRSFARKEVEPAREKGLVLPSPKETNEVKVSNSLGHKIGLASLLPEPQNIKNPERDTTAQKEVSLDRKPSSDVEELTGDEEEILEIEEEFEPISKRAKKTATSEGDDKPKSVGSLFSLLPAPWQAENTWQKRGEAGIKTSSRKQSGTGDRQAKQLIRIAIPTAPSTDSDDEDDMPTTKKVIAPSKEGSGLKLLLPKPKHSITLKADNPNKPSVKLAHRPLLPHTLTKKATATEKKPQKAAKKNRVDDQISDDEDEPVGSFFTFSEKSEDEKIRTLDVQTETSSVKLNKPYLDVQSAPVKLVLDENMPPTVTASQSRETHSNEIRQSPMIEEPAHAQADYGKAENVTAREMETRTYYYEQDTPGQSQQYAGCSGNYYENYNYESGVAAANASSYYGQGAEGYTYTYPTGTTGGARNQPQEADIDLEKLQKLTGRRSRHEEISIVDVNADDQIGNAAEMVAKYGTEEVEHRPSRKKKDMPTAQQRRKHQITYLAFQAKEREFELRQQWSANRQTRRQTQSKYGF